MDEHTVRPYAEAHAAAIAGEDVDHAVADLDDPLRAPMAPVIAQLSSVTTSADIVSVESADDAAVVVIRYSGTGTETTIRSVWKQVGGRPLIVEAAPA